MIPTYTPDALRAVLARHALTGAAAGHLLAVDSRTIRKWTAAADISNHRDMPESAWWLLLILTGDISVIDLKVHLNIERPPLMKIESTPGTDPEPGAALQIRNVTLEPK